MSGYGVNLDGFWGVVEPCRLSAGVTYSVESSIYVVRLKKVFYAVRVLKIGTVLTVAHFHFTV